MGELSIKGIEMEVVRVLMKTLDIEAQTEAYVNGIYYFNFLTKQGVLIHVEVDAHPDEEIIEGLKEKK